MVVARAPGMAKTMATTVHPVEVRHPVVVKRWIEILPVFTQWKCVTLVRVERWIKFFLPL